SPAVRLYVATPALLAHYGITPGQVDPTADVITSRSGLAALQLVAGPRNVIAHPKIQTVDLPTYTSDPNALITAHAFQVLGLHTAPAAWLIQTPRLLTTAQVDAVQKMAAVAGLTIETRPAQQSLSQLRNYATAAGILVGRPLAAGIGGWLLAGREPRAIARQPLE